MGIVFKFVRIDHCIFVRMNLRELNLEYNNLSSLPYSLGTQKSLRLLSIDGNPFEFPFDELVHPLLKSGKVDASPESNSIVTLRRKASLQWERVRGSVRMKRRSDMEEASAALSELVKKVGVKEKTEASSAWSIPEPLSPKLVKVSTTCIIPKKKSFPNISNHTFFGTNPEAAKDEKLLRDSGYCTDSKRESVGSDEGLSPATASAIESTMNSGFLEPPSIDSTFSNASTLSEGETGKRRQTISVGQNRSGVFPVTLTTESLNRVLHYLRDLHDLTLTDDKSESSKGKGKLRILQSAPNLTVHTNCNGSTSPGFDNGEITPEPDQESGTLYSLTWFC